MVEVYFNAMVTKDRCKTVKSTIQEEYKTVKDVVGNGESYRHPDTPLIRYPLVVKEKLGNLPRNSHYNVAIVGAGAAGVGVLYELWRLVRDRPDVKMHVTIYESDSESFSWCQPKRRMTMDHGSETIATRHKRAGRVFSALSLGKSDICDAQKMSCIEKHTVYEIGAMRFPEISGLTWHYIAEVFNETDKIKAFPNPGRVSTEFVFGERVDRFKGNSWLSMSSPTRIVANLVAEGISGTKDGENISMFPIGMIDGAKVAKELGDENTDEVRLAQIKADWKEFVERYDSLSLGGAVREVLKKRHAVLPDIDGLQTIDDKVNYYFELFGAFGFGTGGVKPMYVNSLVEMMRLFLWNYSNEYTLPVEENCDFIRKIFEKATIENEDKNENFTWLIEKAEVTDVCHSGEITGDALVYFNRYGFDAVNKNTHDYVFLAVPPKQLSSMTSRLGTKNEPRWVRFGDHNVEADAEDFVRPPLVLSRSFEFPNAKLLTAINQIHMSASSKVFGTIKSELFNKYAPLYNNERIKAIASDCGLATSYVVPSPIMRDGQPEYIEGVEPEYYSFLLSYNWEDDTKRIISELVQHPINVHNPNRPKDPKHTKMIDAIINHTNRYIKNPETGKHEKWWFHKLLTDDGKGITIHDTVSFDWTTYSSAGGFKQDLPGAHYNSHLLFRYHTHALNSELDNRFFLAGDSYSHLGGWLEGAFMSAVNAVSGFVVSANKGDLNSLSEKARPIITEFDPIAPIPIRRESKDINNNNFNWNLEKPDVPMKDSQMATTIRVYNVE